MEKKNGTICLPCSTGTDIIPVLVIPLVKAAIMSFQYYYVTKPSPNGHYFVGLENYGKVLKDEYFFNSVKVTLIYMW